MTQAQYLNARLSKVQAQLDTVDDAILRLATEDVVEYSFDSGQTTQKATRNDLDQLRRLKDNLLNEWMTLSNRLSGGSARIGVPKF